MVMMVGDCDGDDGGGGSEQMEGKKGSRHQKLLYTPRFICPRHTHIPEGAPLGQALQDTDVGGKIGRTSVKCCAPDVRGWAFAGCHSLDLIVDLQIRNGIPRKGAAPGQASLLRYVLQREGVSILERWKGSGDMQ